MKRRVGLAAIVLMGLGIAAAACGKRKNGGGGDFALRALAQGALSVAPGFGQAIPISIDRSGGYHGAVNVEIASAPGGVTAQPLTIAAGSTGGSLSILVGATAPHGGPFPFEVTAVGGTHTHGQPASVYVAQTTFGPDASLGSAGTLTTTCGSACRSLSDLAFTPDDGIVASAYAFAGTNETFTLAKFTAAGVLDTSFAIAGVDTIAIPGVVSAEADRVAVDAQGRIVVAGVDLGSSPIRTIVARLLPDGSLDSSFASTGYTLNAIASYDAYLYDLELDQEGRIYIAGEGFLSGSGTSVGYIARFLADGALDVDGFGALGGGKVIMADGTFIERIAIDELLSSGPIFMIGAGANGWAIWRYDLDGSPHTGFGQTATGYTQTTVAGLGNAVVINDLGDMLGAGVYHLGSPYPQAIVAFASADGTVQTAFGSSGVASDPYDSSNFTVEQLFYDDPTLWVVGYVTDGSSKRSVVISSRNGNDGSLDTTFGANGFYLTSVDGASTYVVTAKRDAHGRIVVLEDWKNGAADQAAIQRFFP